MFNTKNRMRFGYFHKMKPLHNNILVCKNCTNLKVTQNTEDGSIQQMPKSEGTSFSKFIR